MIDWESVGQALFVMMTFAWMGLFIGIGYRLMGYAMEYVIGKKEAQ